MKITKVNASFAMKKSLGNYEMADIFFAAEAEVMAKDDPEEVALKVHEFCKKLAVQKYNSFTKPTLTAEQEYEQLELTQAPKAYKRTPEEVQDIIKKSSEWMAIDKEGTKRKITKQILTPY